MPVSSIPQHTPGGQELTLAKHYIGPASSIDGQSDHFASVKPDRLQEKCDRISLLSSFMEARLGNGKNIIVLRCWRQVRAKRCALRNTPPLSGAAAPRPA
ncbi:unnamed protein product, partial [Iphiclides podalirius]